MREAVLPLLIAGVFLTVGCDKGSSETSFEPQVNGSQPLSNLSDVEAQRLCEDYASWQADVFDDAALQRMSCAGTAGLAGFSAEGDDYDAASCQAAWDECMQGPAPSVQESSTCEVPNFDGCDADVQAFVDCLNASALEVQRFSEEFSCGGLLSIEPITIPECDFMATPGCAPEPPMSGE